MMFIGVGVIAASGSIGHRLSAATIGEGGSGIEPITAYLEFAKGTDQCSKYLHFSQI